MGTALPRRLSLRICHLGGKCFSASASTATRAGDRAARGRFQLPSGGSSPSRWRRADRRGLRQHCLRSFGTGCAGCRDRSRRLPGSGETAYKGRLPEERSTVRIIWPHHPLYSKRVPLVELWKGSGDRHFVIELPDGSRTRIPKSWADDSEAPLAGSEDGRATTLSVQAIRELLELLTRLETQARGGK